MRKSTIVVPILFAVIAVLALSGTPLTQPAREALRLVRWYLVKNVLLFLAPALFMAGAVGTFTDRAAVIRYMGGRQRLLSACCVAAAAGAVLAVCSCTVLPLFAAIRSLGAGFGPAIAFLYAGPAINTFAFLLTARVLGFGLGLARAVAAIGVSVLVGVLMHHWFPESAPATPVHVQPPDGDAKIGVKAKPYRSLVVLLSMLLMLLFANWARTGDVRAVFLCCPEGLRTYSVEGSIVAHSDEAVKLRGTDGQEHIISRLQLREIVPLSQTGWHARIHAARWILVLLSAGVLVWSLARWATSDELRTWWAESWSFGEQIIPLLIGGVLVAGFIFGTPAGDGILPRRWVELLLGPTPALLVGRFPNLPAVVAGGLHMLWPLWTAFAAATVGAFSYFATTTEVPILQGFMSAGMGNGPALAMLLAGPALSLPTMVVLCRFMGLKRTAAFAGMVVLTAAACGLLFGLLN